MKGRTLEERMRTWLAEPQIVERFAFLRIFAPLAVLGFFSSRVAYANHWIGTTGFSVPDLGGDWRQPIYLPPLPDPLAWLVAALLVVSALLTAVGWRTRTSAAVLACTLIYVTLADRLAAFTVSKISPVILLTIACSAAGARYALDAQAHGDPRPTHAPGGPVRFLQVFLAVFYCSSGFCKARNDWLSHWDVLWTHLHDSYQTPVSYLLANTLPAFTWTILQVTTLVFELGAPLWFAWAASRRIALLYGLLLHSCIGLMFGPVIWFSLLMMVLLIVAYAPDAWLRRFFERTTRALVARVPLRASAR